jgi:hypothetical protein
METITLGEKEIGKIQLGRLVVYITKDIDEIRYAKEYTDTEKNKITYTKHKALRNTDDLEWTRCILGKEYTEVELVPVMPDKPVVVRPELAIQVPPKKTTSFFVGIFVWLQVYGVYKSTKVKICEFPTEKLSKTWFGDNESGEICYILRTQAIRDKDKTMPTFYHATCPVHVTNNSEDMLDFQRICLHVELLTLYSDGQRLWANAARVLYKGIDQISQINLSNTAPKEARNCSKISGPRMTATPSIVKRSFYFLKYLTGLVYA